MTEYDVLSWSPRSARWGLDDIGLDREEAIAHMVMRAMRWDEWNAVALLTRILRGADPEVPMRMQIGYHDDESLIGSDVLMCIRPGGAPRPDPPTG